MEIKYKNRTYTITYEKLNGLDFGGYTASWLGYSAQGNTQEKALENCHQMIENDYEQDQKYLLDIERDLE